MFAQTNLYSALATNITQGAYRPITPAHYVQKEREPYVVLISSTKSNVQVSLPGLEPQFVNIASTLGTRCEDMYYQFRSFRFHNRFPNIAPGDYLEVLSWAVISSIIPDANGLVTQPMNDKVYDAMMSSIARLYPVRISLFPAGIDEREWECLSGSEIAWRFNTSVRELIQGLVSVSVLRSPILKIYPYLGGDYETLLQVFDIWQLTLDILYKLTLKFDNDSGKFVFELPHTYSIFTQLKRGDLIDRKFTLTRQDLYAETQKRKIYREIQLFICPGQGLGYTARQRLIKCFGMSSLHEPEYDVSIIGQAIHMAQDDLLYVYMKNRRAGMPYLMDFPYPRVDTDTVHNVLRYFDDIAHNYLHDKIYIRSSLRTNTVDENGKRSDVLQVVQSHGYHYNEYVEYQPHYVGGRDYNSKDSLASLRSFHISLTDEYGNSITFNQPWELYIAIFFTPPDVAVTTY